MASARKSTFVERETPFALSLRFGTREVWGSRNLEAANCSELAAAVVVILSLVARGTGADTPNDSGPTSGAAAIPARSRAARSAARNGSASRGESVDAELARAAEPIRSTEPWTTPCTVSNCSVGTVPDWRVEPLFARAESLTVL
jgi:hypothetical protein